MPFSGGKFKSHPGQVKSTGEKTPPAKTGMHEQGKGPAQSPHGGSSEEHVTKTHPGTTQPHPTTGVHAFHANHTGGGKYQSHTHHDGGEVETREHPSAGDMHAAMSDALPDDQQGDGMNDQHNGGQDFGEELGGIGGDAGV